ncbi:Gfo/Idh/MocA family oxidoreductase [Terrarubrum flagellatum]|uniref:Gfo/Idh/MocA family protein n=1 Tax=Terrirubrum flagellatum TaxID=2895980 RepID=UPI0031450C18
MPRKVRWGVLSTAQIGVNQVIPAMQAGAYCEIVGIASREEERARDVANKLGIPQAFGSYEALLASPDIEAIYNPLPNHLHAALTIQALEAGKHVLCEKPIALNAEEARGILAAQRRTGRIVAEAFMVRFHPQWRQARELILEGRLGDVRSIQTIFSYFLTDPENIRNRADIGGGGLYDIGCYAVNAARFLFGEEPTRAIGLFDRDPLMATDRLTSGLVEFPEGRHLTFTCATQLVPCQRVQVLGSRARIEIQIPFNAPRAVSATMVLDDGRDLVGGGRETIELAACDQYTLQGDAFSQAVLGERALEWGLEDAVANMRVIDALFRSARSEWWERP